MVKQIIRLINFSKSYLELRQLQNEELEGWLINNEKMASPETVKFGGVIFKIKQVFQFI
jgi:hypothetical protein